tara:strand:- start:662 stop:1198 length:537 start_codon:yes stop_codon:yes gene_type:complete
MNKQLDIRVKDNFLNDRDFTLLKEIFFHTNTTWKTNWTIADELEVSKEDNYDDWFLGHMVYSDYKIESSAFNDIKEKLIEPIKQLELNRFNQLTRIKANFYPHTDVVKEHPIHVDGIGYKCRGALFSFNTCDGYTGFADGTKIESVENRLILFDALQEHYSTSTSNAQARINLNINYV